MSLEFNGGGRVVLAFPPPAHPRRELVRFLYQALEGIHSSYDNTPGQRLVSFNGIVTVSNLDYLAVDGGVYASFPMCNEVVGAMLEADSLSRRLMG